MANDEDVARLRQGAAVWNAWLGQGPERHMDLRRENLSRADLSEADLHGADLSEADLHGADLRVANLMRANLWGANLMRANLERANLSEADLRGANLMRAHLWGADLRGANLELAALRSADLRSADLRRANLIRAKLSGANLEWANLELADLRGANLANLIRAKLSGLEWATFEWADLRAANLANLSEADLGGANLSGAKLSGADLGGAKLSGANLSGANLSEAKLSEADLGGADLGGAKLVRANLRRADLGGADLRDADLRQATLIDSRLAGANLTGAKLWETQRDGWSIKGVICQRAFWDRDGEESTEYGVGDFERIFAEKPRIVLRYPDSMSAVDLAMLPLIVERLEAKHPGCALHIRSLEDAGAGAVVTITVDDLAGRDAETFRGEVEMLRCSIMAFQQRLGHEERLRLQFEARYTALVTDIVPMLLDRIPLRQEINIGQLTGPIIEETRMSRDTYNIQRQTGAVGPNAHAHDFQQVWSQSGLDLPRLAQELARLRAAMKQETEGTTEQDEAIGAVAAAEKAAAGGDGPTVLRHLKAAGKWTLGIAEKIGVAVATKAIEGAMAGSA